MLPPLQVEFAELHRAILEDPDDDIPRYTLADWFDRNKMITRAETLRQGVRGRETFRGPLPGPFQGRAIFNRGFVEQVFLRLDTFLDHAGEIFGDHPITRVEFVDLVPVVDLFGLGTFGWITGFPPPDDMFNEDLIRIDHEMAMLDDPLASEVEGLDAVGVPMFKGKVYLSVEDAIDALSRAAVSVGRAAAGLSQLSSSVTIITG